MTDNVTAPPRDLFEHAEPVPFAELVKAFSHIGLLSFGGPAAQIALLHRVCVEEKRWVSEDRFLHALNFCMLLPGPEAQQLATYIGWLIHGVRGGMVAGLLFVLPGLAVILGLSTLYAYYHEVGWVAGLFFGLKAAILAIVVEAVVRIGRRALKTRFHRLIALVAFLALFALALPFPLVVLMAGLAGLAEARALARHETQEAPAHPAMVTAGGGSRRFVRSMATLVFWLLVWQAPLLPLWLLAGEGALAEIFSFFSRMALVTFGGAYAVLAYVAQVAVEEYQWLRPGEMLDGLALAETTPGPLVLVLSYVGFLAGFREAGALPALAGGLFGGLLAAWATFVPSFIWIFAGAPHVERLRGNRMITAALSAITAAVVGVILNLAVWFALHVLFGRVDQVRIWPLPAGDPGGAAKPFVSLSLPWPDPASLDPAALALALFSAAMIFLLKQGMGRTLVAAAALGLVYRLIA
ncbi:MAG: chromate efflux transporter [Allorhizobium sp.]